MLYREIIAVCSEIQTKHTKAAVRQKVGIFNVKPGGTHSDHCAEHIVTASMQSVNNTNVY